MTKNTKEVTYCPRRPGTYCRYCSNDFTPLTAKQEYCSTECGQADARDYEATEQSKWA